MHILTAHLTEATLWTQPTDGCIHSVFEHAVNLLMKVPKGQRLLTVVPQGERLPDSLEAPCAALESLRSCPPGSHVQWIGNYLCWMGGGGSVSLDPWTGRMPRVDFKWRGESTLPLNVTSGKERMVEEKLIRTLQELQCGNVDGAAQQAKSFIGLGGGLTPAADDALLGALAVYCAIHQPLSFLTEELFGRTTLVSAHYLHCAQRGFFSQRVLDVMTASDIHLSSAAKKLCAWGGTSGRDTLFGIAAAGRYFQNGFHHTRSD